MPKDPRKKRKAPISYRPPAALEGEFYARVRDSGLSVSGFITRSVLGAKAPRAARSPGVSTQELGRLMRELARLTDALVARENSGALDAEDKALLAQLRTHLLELRAAILKAAGRKP